jgi:hypothetical protein
MVCDLGAAIYNIGSIILVKKFEMARIKMDLLKYIFSALTGQKQQDRATPC